MKKILSIVTLAMLTLMMSGCTIIQDIENIGMDDFEILYEYARQNGEFGTNDNGNHYFYLFPNTDYAMWVYGDEQLELMYFDNSSSPEITVIIDYQYGQLSDGFMLLYSYTDEDFDDFGYDDDALYLPGIGSVIVIFDNYDGLTKEYDEGIAEEYALSLIEYVDRYFNTRVGISLK
jgi:hypothetical protein